MSQQKLPRRRRDFAAEQWPKSPLEALALAVLLFEWEEIEAREKNNVEWATEIRQCLVTLRELSQQVAAPG